MGWNNTNVLPYSSGGHKAKMGLSRLKRGYWHGCASSRGARGESASLPFSSIQRLPAFLAHGPASPQSLPPSSHFLLWLGLSYIPFCLFFVRKTNLFLIVVKYTEQHIYHLNHFCENSSLLLNEWIVLQTNFQNVFIFRKTFSSFETICWYTMFLILCTQRISAHAKWWRNFYVKNAKLV